MSNKRYYYVSGHTAKGYVNYFDTNVRDIKCVIVLKHSSELLKTQILRKVINAYELTDSLEVICSAQGTSYIDGVIMREKSVAIVTDSVVDDTLTNTVNINIVDDIASPLTNQDISTITQHKERLTQQAYDLFLKGLQIHDDLEAIYIKEMNFKKADERTEEFIRRLLKDIPRKKRSPKVYRRFFGTNTADGAVNILPEITDHLSKRVYVKGRAGTGKSVFMKKIAHACESHGFDVEYYHCSFDPGSVDMILVPALDFSIFDSTHPHEYFPERQGDMIVDLYEETVTPGTDEKYAESIHGLTVSYKGLLKAGIDHLKRARSYQKQLDHPYLTIDQVAAQKVLEKILNHI